MIHRRRPVSRHVLLRIECLKVVQPDAGPEIGANNLAPQASLPEVILKTLPDLQCALRIVHTVSYRMICICKVKRRLLSHAAHPNMHMRMANSFRAEKLGVLRLRQLQIPQRLFTGDSSARLPAALLHRRRAGLFTSLGGNALIEHILIRGGVQCPCVHVVVTARRAALTPVQACQGGAAARGSVD